MSQGGQFSMSLDKREVGADLVVLAAGWEVFPVGGKPGRIRRFLPVVGKFPGRREVGTDLVVLAAGWEVFPVGGKPGRTWWFLPLAGKFSR